MPRAGTKPQPPASHWKPQTELDQRMLAQAVLDLGLPVPKGRRERSKWKFAFESASEWLFRPPDTTYHFSLARVCERLDRQPGQVAGQVWTTLSPEVQERVRETFVIRDLTMEGQG